MTTWPDWWRYALELTPHVQKRMEDRNFTEVDLRVMLQRASGFRGDVVPERFVIETQHAGKPWEVIVEPDIQDSLLVVITAYEVSST